MAGFLTSNTDYLTRSALWSRELKDVLLDELFATKYIRWLQDFPDGDLIHIPSIGQLEAQDYAEGQAVKYSAMDTGDFTMQVTEYLQSGTYITEKFRQDSYYTAELMSRFVPEMSRSLNKRMEVDALRVGPEAQTTSDPNAINGVAHRWIGTGGSFKMDVEDFARARLALQKANVPMTDLIAIVDPSVEFTFNTQANITNIMYNPMWEGIVRDSIGTGMKFKVNIYGFDVYVSQNLKSGLTDTIYTQTATNGVANLLFSAASGVQPFVGALRQSPKVDSEYNKDLQREEYVTTCRYGMKLFRPENLVVVITDNTIADPTYA
jgi:hypothetical protein